MALFGDALVLETTALVRRHCRELGTAIGEGQDAQGNPDLSEEMSPLQCDLKLLVRVANGEHARDDSTLRRVEVALANVLAVLLGNALRINAMLPDEFWRTDIGIVVSRVRWWLWVDDIITISNAAALAFGENNQANRMRIVRAIDRGLLEWVPDPSVANPQQNRRVLRPQVERLRDQRRLPE